MGLCNLLGSFVSSMPTTGSFTRTAVNNTSGVRTTLGGIFTGSLVLLALGLLTETFYFIPKTVLAAVIISAMIFMVEVELVFTLWKTKRNSMVQTFILQFLINYNFRFRCHSSGRNINGLSSARIGIWNPNWNRL